MDRDTAILLVMLRSALLGAAGVLVIVAGFRMRSQGSGIPSDYGLLAYGLGLALLGLAVPLSVLAERLVRSSDAVGYTPQWPRRSAVLQRRGRAA